ncbi:hypothetical protein [Streptomyces albogriseolus]|uniref:hypothetical protein n=1 Tax=Streptomyces albogriseolus TaxID=1887 RepID=UPI002253F24F|nr:hypothetical protein [Streptomyces viridodiastaticus]MCX4624399.1 hypothetical protein [Streptomyces viridodiastaticus]MCX4624700.1 hypothetical protein [Streptomyces viridodiastaticus]
MSGTQTFTTPAGNTYSYAVETGENGEAVYDLSRVLQDGVFPIGTVVVHPNWELFPKVAGLLNVQFGKGSATDRHERTDAPKLGDMDLPYVVGSHLVNPADLTAETDNGAAPLLTFRKRIMGAAFETNSPAENASQDTFEKVRDLVTGLITTYQADKATPEREAAYTKFLNGKRAEAVQAEIDKLDDKAQALAFMRAELVEKLNGYKTA